MRIGGGDSLGQLSASQNMADNGSLCLCPAKRRLTTARLIGMCWGGAERAERRRGAARAVGEVRYTKAYSIDNAT